MHALRSPHCHRRSIGTAGGTVVAMTVALSAYGSVTLDGTFGPVGPLSGPDYAITANLGRQVGGNLFHSFGQFSIHTGESVTFSGPNSVNNIIGRVTGGDASFIDGTLRSTIPGANLYLLNPAGVLFGEHAQLDVPGSVHVSTADYLRLGDGGRFDARTPGNSVLTVAPVEAFGFLNATPAPITASGSFLQVPEGQILSLIGGDITLTNATLYASAGRINVAAMGSAGEVLPTDNDLVSQGFARLGALTITRTGDPFELNENEIADVDASGRHGGAIFIRGGRWVSEGGAIASNTWGDQDGHGISIEVDRLDLRAGGLVSSSTFDTGRGGAIQVTARDALTIDGARTDANGDTRYSGLVADSWSGNSDAGSIHVKTARLSLTHGGRIASGANGTGRSRVIDITAEESVTTEGGYVDTKGVYHPSQITTYAENNDAGAINLTTGHLAIRDGRIFSSTNGQGMAGDLMITARADVTIDGAYLDADGNAQGSDLSSSTNDGYAGNITLATTRLSLTGGGQITSYAWNEGRSGNLDLTAKESVTVGGGYVDVQGAFNRSLLATYAKRYAGHLTLTTDHLNLTGGGAMASFFWGDNGQGGDIAITAYETTVIDAVGSGVFAEAYGTPGDAGDITLATTHLSLTGGGQIASRTFGTGRGGNLDLTAHEAVTIEGIGYNSDAKPVLSGLFAYSYGDDATGQAGNIQLTTARLSISGDGMIDSSAYGKGQGGNIDVTAMEAVTIHPYSGIRVSGAQGDAGTITLTTPDLQIDTGGIYALSESASGGNLTINTDHLKLFNGAEISSSVSGGESSNGGNLTINSINFVALNGSSVTARAHQGKGGNILVNAEVFLHDTARADEVLNASSEVFGNDGTVQNNAPTPDISGSLVALNTSYLGAAGQLSPRCGTGDPEERSRFIVQGRGSLPPDPGDALSVPAGHCRAVPDASPRTTSHEPLTTVMTGFGDR